MTDFALGPEWKKKGSKKLRPVSHFEEALVGAGIDPNKYSKAVLSFIRRGYAPTKAVREVDRLVSGAATNSRPENVDEVIRDLDTIIDAPSAPINPASLDLKAPSSSSSSSSSGGGSAIGILSGVVPAIPAELVNNLDLFYPSSVKRAQLLPLSVVRGNNNDVERPINQNPTVLHNYNTHSTVFPVPVIPTHINYWKSLLSDAVLAWEQKKAADKREELATLGWFNTGNALDVSLEGNDVREAAVGAYQSVLLKAVVRHTRDVILSQLQDIDYVEMPVTSEERLSLVMDYFSMVLKLVSETIQSDEFLYLSGLNDILYGIGGITEQLFNEWALGVANLDEVHDADTLKKIRRHVLPHLNKSSRITTKPVSVYIEKINVMLNSALDVAGASLACDAMLKSSSTMLRLPELQELLQEAIKELHGERTLAVTLPMDYYPLEVVYAYFVVRNVDVGLLTDPINTMAYAALVNTLAFHEFLPVLEGDNARSDMDEADALVSKFFKIDITTAGLASANVQDAQNLMGKIFRVDEINIEKLLQSKSHYVVALKGFRGSVSALGQATKTTTTVTKQPPSALSFRLRDKDKTPKRHRISGVWKVYVEDAPMLCSLYRFKWYRVSPRMGEPQELLTDEVEGTSPLIYSDASDTDIVLFPGEYYCVVEGIVDATSGHVTHRGRSSSIFVTWTARCVRCGSDYQLRAEEIPPTTRLNRVYVENMEGHGECRWSITTDYLRRNNSSLPLFTNLRELAIHIIEESREHERAHPGAHKKAWYSVSAYRMNEVHQIAEDPSVAHRLGLTVGDDIDLVANYYHLPINYTLEASQLVDTLPTLLIAKACLMLRIDNDNSTILFLKNCIDTIIANNNNGRKRNNLLNNDASAYVLKADLETSSSLPDGRTQLIEFIGRHSYVTALPDALSVKKNGPDGVILSYPSQRLSDRAPLPEVVDAITRIHKAAGQGGEVNGIRDNALESIVEMKAHDQETLDALTEKFNQALVGV
jgi:hypothetical protein